MVTASPGRVKRTAKISKRVDDGEGHVAVEAAYAGLITRAIAIVLDAVIVNVVALAVTGAVLVVRSVFSVAGKHHGVAVVIGGAAFIIWLISYFVVFWTTTGQTPGSRVMHVRVVRTDGTRLRPRHALIRLGAMVVSLPLFWGYLPILTTAHRRGVPDALAGTVVVGADHVTRPGPSPPTQTAGF